MLGRTAQELFWMARYLERSENTARLIDAGFRMTLTRSHTSDSEWTSVLATVGCSETFWERHEELTTEKMVDFLIRDKTNAQSVISTFKQARDNARRARTALTAELWEAINESWLELKALLKRPISNAALPSILSTIRRHGALIMGCIHATMLRNDIYRFCQLGLLIERADNTARILDVKYYVLLPNSAFVGSALDNVQWEMLLRSASAQRAFYWVHQGEVSPSAIASFLILDHQLPRSLAYCYDQIVRHLDWLTRLYDGQEPESHLAALRLHRTLNDRSIADIIDYGLHEFITEFISSNAEVAHQVELDYRFRA